MFNQGPGGESLTFLPVVLMDMLGPELRHRNMAKTVYQMLTALLVRLKCVGRIWVLM